MIPFSLSRCSSMRPVIGAEKERHPLSRLPAYFPALAIVCMFLWNSYWRPVIQILL